MIKIVASSDAPGRTSTVFAKAPKTLYRMGNRYGRTEEPPNLQTGVRLVVIVAEPDLWIVDLASRRGMHQRDKGPTFNFRARIFGDPSIKSKFISALEFGCEASWMIEAGAQRTTVKHPELGDVERLEYREDSEMLVLYTRSGLPRRLELHLANQLQSIVDYQEYVTNLQFQKTLFERPAGIDFGSQKQP